MNKKNILVIVLSSLFILLTILVALDLTNGLDNFVYQMVTHYMSSPLTQINKIFTFFGSTLFIIILSLIVFIFFLIKKKKNCSFIVAGVIIISTIINNVIKVIIRRERPTVLALVLEKSFSYPSGHTMASFSLYGILLYLVIQSKIKKSWKIILSIILILIPILVALSRIYLGAHFASDVLGAILMSLVILLSTISIIDKKEWL